MIRSPTRPIFVLFGDSITQRACGPDGWATILAEAYQRRVDVINRGYSGYNTRWARHIMNDVFPSSSDANILLTTIFFGANDAALPGRTSGAQHVALEEYVDNIRAMISTIQARLPKSAIILITPPPVDEQARLQHAFTTYGVVVEQCERTNQVTGQYADAAKRLGEEARIPVLNLWAEFQKASPDDWKKAFLSDGLHLSPAGNELVGRLILELIEKKLNHISVAHIPWDFPDWRDLAQT